ncbi:MAG: beta-lactamase family protein [bacterium]|nr:beta-lactamase family protein [bacterium]
MIKKVNVQGVCESRFSKVKEAFIRNLESGDDNGASFAVSVDGKMVVDLWGGFADTAQTRLWRKDTITCVFSSTKVMTALCALMLVDRGLLDLDTPVAAYWPEFAQAGKAKLPVRYLFSHQSGLAGFDEKVTVEDLYNWDKCVAWLAAQKPWWEPGTRSGYHGWTFGYLLGELVRRITRKSLGTFFREEVAEPLLADFYIGLPAELDKRVAELILPPGYEEAKSDYRTDLGEKVFNNHVGAVERWNDRAWRKAEMPSVNGHCNARGAVRITSFLACGGELNGKRLLKESTINEAITEQINNLDLILATPMSWGLGFILNSKEMPISPNPRAFAWGGMGGSMIFIDPDAKMSWAFVMNKLADDAEASRRWLSLGIAVYDSLYGGTHHD